MNYRSPLILMFSLFACDAVESEMSPEDALLITTLSAEEEGMIDHEQSNEDESQMPQLFRVCDRALFFDELSTNNDAVESTDTDSGWLDSAENLFSRGNKKGKKKSRHGKKMLKRLMLIYDVDQDGSLSELEKADLFDDFDARCEALHEKVLLEFDADADGELSAEEKDAAKQSIAERKEAHKAANPCSKDKDEDELNLPPFAREFDLDGDDELSETELQTLRDVLRERIRNGESWNKPELHSEASEADLESPESETEESDEDEESDLID